MFCIIVYHVQYQHLCTTLYIRNHILVTAPTLVGVIRNVWHISSSPAARLRCQEALELSGQSLMGNRNVSTNLSATNVDLRSH